MNMSEDNVSRRHRLPRWFTEDDASLPVDKLVPREDQFALSAESHCPAWCTITHGQLAGADDEVHVGGALLVRGRLLRLCSAVGQEPYLMVGDEELTLYQAEALAAALTQLVAAAREAIPGATFNHAAPGTPTLGP